MNYSTGEFHKNISDNIAALYVRSDSIYKSLLIDCYDIQRDARNFTGSKPVIAHPPCRAWGRLRAFAKPRTDERELAFHALSVVRNNGGILEHPANSSFWKTAALSRPGIRDDYDVITYVIDQSWFGHPAPKRTYLYCVGIHAFPTVNFHLGTAQGRVQNQSKPAREKTPYLLACFLINTINHNFL